MNIPTPEFQIQFLSNVQRLLSDGQFVATYKFALLLALADICVEGGEDTDATLTIHTRKIAEKFIQYYWRQSKPYLGQGVLRQNTGREAGVVRLLRDEAAMNGSLLSIKRDENRWMRLIGEVASIVKDMPLWKLQTVGDAQVDFLYPVTGSGQVIDLHPGVMYCFRKFHSLISDLVRGAWVRYIRRFNCDALGSSSDLDQFLFGTERASLNVFGPILVEIQGGRCFYCQKGIAQNDSRHIDHFVPWERYPVDLGHNFVLAHEKCNLSKSDHLAAVSHLKRWAERNRSADAYFRDRFEKVGISHNLVVSTAITRWAYANASAMGAPLWIRNREFEPITPDWVHFLN